MKTLIIIKNIFKYISVIMLLIFISICLLYLCISPYSSVSVKNRVLNTNEKVCTRVIKVQKNKNIELLVTPDTSFVDEKVTIKIKGLESNQVGRLKLSVIDSKKMYWESSACFKADKNGEINVNSQAPLVGSSYTGIHQMGPFWSLKPKKISSFNFNTDLNYIVSFETDINKIERKIFRKKSCTNVNFYKRSIRTHIVADLYLHKGNKKKPAIILLGGSGGNFQSEKAKYLVSKGYNVLDLKYFGAEKLPENLENIPLEYLHRAVIWLKNQSTVDISKIALMGRSKGAEYALLYASKYNDICALISEVGSSVTWSSKRYFTSSWKYQGKSMPRAKGGIIEAIRYIKSIDNKAVSQLPYMLNAFENTKRIQKSLIQVENIKCPILLISGEDDMQWPSTMMSNQIKSRAEEYQFKYEINHHAYKNAGHQFDALPYVPQVDFSNYRTWKSGGDFQGNALASIDSWNRIFSFLNRHFGKMN